MEHTEPAENETNNASENETEGIVMLARGNNFSMAHYPAMNLVAIGETWDEAIEKLVESARYFADIEKKKIAPDFPKMIKICQSCIDILPVLPA